MGKINLGNGMLEMDTDATRAVMDALVAHGEAFSTAWTAADQAAGANESSIGRHHKLTKDFQANYAAAVEALRESAPQVKPTFDALATSGRESVTMYEETDTKHAANISRSGK